VHEKSQTFITFVKKPQHLKPLLFGLAFVFFVSFPCAAQKPAQYIEQGKVFEEQKNYPQAFAYYYEAYTMDSTSFEVTVRYAEMARETKEFELALSLYAKIASKDKGKLFPLASFWQGHIYKLLGRYEEALTYFRKYTKKNKKKGEYFYEKALREIEACTWAANYKSAQDTLSVVTLPKILNSDDSEVQPRFFEKKLFFSRFQSSQSAWSAWQSDWKDSLVENVKQVKGLPKELKQPANLFFVSENEVVLTAIKNETTGVWHGRRGKDSWEELNFISAEGAVCTMPHVAAVDGFEYLFFSSDRIGGEGGMDIWMARKDGDSFSNPFPAGNLINTVDNEISPFFSESVLYFSSDGHQGFGGWDVFKSAGKPGNWSKVTNLGNEINSSMNDIGFSIYPSEGLLFFTSNKPKKENEKNTCCSDLYMSFFGKEKSEPLPSELPYASLEEMNRFLPITLYFHNDEPNPRTRDTTTTLTYSDAYASYKKLQGRYEQEVEKWSDEEAASTEVNNFFALRVDKGMQDLNVFSELLLRELRQGNNVTLSIRGFASPRAESDYNERLTKRRIQSLVNEMRVLAGGAFVPFMEGKDSTLALLSFQALPFW
jgi:tetratricopeptide (TPR) repeat protein